MGLRQVAPAPSMRMENLDFHVPLGTSVPRLPQLVKALQEHVGAGAYPLRVSIAGIDDRGANVEATVLHYDPAGPHAEDLAGWELLHPCRKTRQAPQFCAVQIVPTGIRCELGGYAGDAGPATRSWMRSWGSGSAGRRTAARSARWNGSMRFWPAWSAL